MGKIKVFIDYPVTANSEFKGLSFPQVLFNYLKTRDDVQLVGEDDDCDILFLISGGSHYSNFNKLSLSEKLLERLGECPVFNFVFGKSFSKYMRANNYYERRVSNLIKRNPKAKIVHRLDDRYRVLCKVYGFDETVQRINSLSDVTIFQTKYCEALYTKGVKTVFGFEKPYDIKHGLLIHNGVDQNYFNEKGPTFNLAGSIKVLHVAATGMTRKGLGTVLEFADALKSNNEIQFYLIGNQDTDPINGRFIGKYPNVHHIKFTSDRNELAMYYRSCSILLYPTLNDCSPNVVLEAMSCGPPVLAANSGGTPELIIKSDIQGGLLINDENPIYNFNEILVNHDKFSDNARELISRYHSSQVMGDKYMKLFRDLLTSESKAQNNSIL